MLPSGSSMAAASRPSGWPEGTRTDPAGKYSWRMAWLAPAKTSGICPSSAGAVFGPTSRTMSTATVRGSASVSNSMPCRRSSAITSGLVAGTHHAAGSVTTLAGACPNTGMA